MSVRDAALVACLLAACTDTLPEIRINEVAPANLTGCPDVFGEPDDWVELTNTTSSAIDLGGYRLFDNTTAPDQAVVAPGVTIAPRGYLLLWADGKIQGLDHLPYKLSAGGDSLTLQAPDGSTLDEVSWASADPDVSYARVPDVVGEFTRCATPTCGAGNDSSCGATRTGRRAGAPKRDPDEPAQ